MGKDKLGPHRSYALFVPPGTAPLDAFGRPRDGYSPPPKKYAQQPPGSGRRKGKALVRRGLRP
jgi:hypothetical protein